MPSDQHNLAALNLQAGQDTRDHAAARVEIGRGTISCTCRAVRVAANGKLTVHPGPINQLMLKTLIRLIKVDRFGRSRQIEQLQSTPDTAHDKPAELVQPVALEISLMAMDHKKPLARAHMFEDKAFIGNHAVLFDLMALAALNIMIAQDKTQAVLRIELVQQVEDTPVRFSNNTESPIFPELVPIPNFNVAEPILIITCQHVEK